MTNMDLENNGGFGDNSVVLGVSDANGVQGNADAKSVRDEVDSESVKDEVDEDEQREHRAWTVLRRVFIVAVAVGVCVVFLFKSNVFDSDSNEAHASVVTLGNTSYAKRAIIQVGDGDIDTEDLPCDLSAEEIEEELANNDWFSDGVSSMWAYVPQNTRFYVFGASEIVIHVKHHAHHQSEGLVSYIHHVFHLIYNMMVIATHKNWAFAVVKFLLHAAVWYGATEADSTGSYVAIVVSIVSVAPFASTKERFYFCNGLGWIALYAVGHIIGCASMFCG
jgi:hypothetical protein